jgi:probable F420-dependent oxidoreductase
VMDESVGAAVEIAERADASRLHSVWTIEYYNRNPFVRLAAMAARTRRIGLGSGIAVALARSPLVIATAALDLDELSDGRLTLGLGTSTKRMNEEWYGRPFEHPAGQLEEIVLLLKALFNHQEGPFLFDGRYHRLKLDHYGRANHNPHVPILTAGVNQRMVEVAGRVAEGVIGHPIATTKYINEILMPALKTGSAKEPRTSGSPLISSQIITSINSDINLAKREAAAQIAFYATVKTYDAIHKLHGFEEEVGSIRNAFYQGDTERMIQCVSKPMLNAMSIYGGAHDVLDQLERYRGLVDIPVLYSPHFGIDEKRIRQNELAIIELWG